MVKKATVKKNKQVQPAPRKANAPRKRNRVGRQSSPVPSQMANYMKLLADPCGSDLVRAPYLGTGSGYLVRTKEFISTTQSTGATDFYLEVHPSGVSGVGGYLNMATYGYSTTPGGSLGTASAFDYPSFLQNTIVGYFRPVAGCAKIHYLGTELDRKGMVGVSVQNGLQIHSQEVIGFTAPAAMGTMQRAARLGSEAMEVRWVPAETDGEWVGRNQPALTYPTQNNRGTSIQIVGSGCPAGSVSIELTFVWEWQTATQGASGSVTSGLAPNITKSLGFTLNDVLHRVGDVVRFATSPDTRAVLASAARGMYNALGPLASGLAIAY